MKTCLGCGNENSDNARRCRVCDTATFVGSSPEAAGGHIISPDEKAFWERMRFREFAIICLRLEALLLLVRVLEIVIYLPSYFQVFHGDLSAVPGREVSAYLALLRLALAVAAALLAFRFSPASSTG